MYVVDGFEFQTKEEARQAKKESDGIRYIKDQTDMSDPDTVYKLYLSCLLYTSDAADEL